MRNSFLILILVALPGILFPLAAMAGGVVVFQNQYSQDGCGFYAATTIPAAITTTGTQTVTPAAMADSQGNYLEAGLWVTVANPDGSNAENVEITTTTASTFTATFTSTKLANSTVHPYCNYRYYPSVNNNVNDPIAVYICGGGWIDCQVGVTAEGSLRGHSGVVMGYEFYALTQMGYQVYAPRYTTYADPGYTTVLSPQDMRNLKCFFSRLANHEPSVWQGGNVNNITIMGDSAGGVDALMMLMTPNSQWLTDGNGSCEDLPSNATTSWTIRQGIFDSVAGDLDNALWSTGAFTSVFGSGSNSSTLAYAMSADNPANVASWEAKGRPPITLVSGADDNTFIPALQQDLITAINGAGGTVNWSLINGLPHGVDQGTLDQADGEWTPNLANILIAGTSPNCSQTGATKCATLGNVWRITTAALASRSSFSSGGSGSSGSSF
jgi:acetyl esterase/lipase